MALRDGGAGTIKIALHPETLGHVKIHLEMTENKITGRIVVESEEALHAFRKELSALEQAFKDSGYANADLNLSLTADGSSEQEHNFDESSFSSRMAASSYEDGYELESAPVINVILRRGTGQVNMLA
jgi:flagellar hook-length control protein FliK